MVDGIGNYRYAPAMRINGPTLAAIREGAGHSQLSLAAETGGIVSQGRISEIEAGDKRRDGAPLTVRPATAKALAAALHVPLTAITVPEPKPAAS